MNTREQWILFAKLLENRARETKASGLAASAIALMGAAADATAVARAIGCLTDGCLLPYEHDGDHIWEKPTLG
jgi:hypothetical protein